MILAALVFLFLPAHQADESGRDRSASPFEQIEQLQAAGRYREALAQTLALVRQMDAGKASSPELANALVWAGALSYDLGRLDDAERFGRRALKIARELGRDGQRTAVLVLENLATLYFETGEIRRVEHTLALLLEVLNEARSSEATGRALHVIGSVQASLGRRREAETTFRQLESWLETRGEPQAGSRCAAVNNLALAIVDQGRYSEAVRELRRAHTFCIVSPGAGFPQTARVLMNLASAIARSGAPRDALPHYETALGIAEASLGPDSLLAGTILKSYSVALRKSGRKDDAREAERRGREIEQRAGVRPGATIDVSELMRSR